jgi:putative Mg2+ transporter-C (MgtC) family protein
MNTRDLFTDPTYLDITLRLLLSLFVGSLIGFERSFHGRPAGFRTHALVCLSTSLLMLITVYETRWFPGISQGRISLDPTRMAQGIMTGIGFLGAGTIMREGMSVRGLTTAASLWITAAIGILVGIGFFFPALLATALTLGTLSLFRWLEVRMPTQLYVYCVVRFGRQGALSETGMRRLLQEHGFTIGKLSYRLNVDASFLEYRMNIRTGRGDNAGKLTEALGKLPAVQEFRLVPTGG